MEILILILHGLVVGAAFYLGFCLFFYLIVTYLIGDAPTPETPSFMDKCMDRLPFPMLIVLMLTLPFLIFILSFVPAFLALAFGPAYIFEVTSMFDCHAVVIGVRGGVTEITSCTKAPVWLGVIASFCGCAYFHILRHNVTDEE